jgi:hypothetical protein
MRDDWARAVCDGGLGEMQGQRRAAVAEAKAAGSSGLGRAQGAVVEAWLGDGAVARGGVNGREAVREMARPRRRRRR